MIYDLCYYRIGSFRSFGGLEHVIYRIKQDSLLESMDLEEYDSVIVLNHTFKVLILKVLSNQSYWIMMQSLGGVKQLHLIAPCSNES